MTDLKQKFLSAAKKLLLGTGMAFSTLTGIASQQSTHDANSTNKQTTEILVSQAKDTHQNINYSKVKIRSYEDLEKMFDQALPIIFNTLILEYGIDNEVIEEETDNIKPTVGTGFEYIPISLDECNDPKTVWLSISNLCGAKPVSYTKLTDNDIMKLIISWGKYRIQTQEKYGTLIKRHKTVLRRIYESVKGAELRPNELAAIYCAIFNNEDNLRNICMYVQDYYNNPLKCANMLMSKTKGYGYKDLENIAPLNALVYLNYNNFCEAMLYMPFDNNSKKTCLDVAALTPKTLTEKNYKVYSDKCKKELLGCFFYPTYREVPQNIISLIPTSLLSYKVAPNVASPDPNQRDFEIAITHMSAKSYNEAMNIFNKLEKTSNTNAVLLQQMTQCYYEMEQYDNAIKYGQKILNSFNKTERAEAAYYVGKSYMGKKQPDQATIFFKKAIDATGYLPPKTRKLYEIVYRGALDDAIQAQNELLQLQKEKRQQVQY